MPLTKYREFDHEDRRAKITRRKRGPSPIRSMLGVTLIEVPDNVRELTGTEGMYFKLKSALGLLTASCLLLKKQTSLLRIHRPSKY